MSLQFGGFFVSILPARVCVAHRSLWKLTKDLNGQGRLAVFVGAGLSMGCGLPSWDVLVERVLRQVWKNAPQLVDHFGNRSNLLAARYARKKSGEKFNRIVHDCLYQEGLEISPCLMALAKSGVRQICTFNFDDTLEEALLTDGAECVIATPDEAFEARHDQITVYHPHGILPRFHQKEELDAIKIVFSEDDYHNLYSDPYSWANIAQLSLLTTYSVVFVGLSMQDPNLRRLIDVVRSRGFRNQHFAVFRDPTKGCSADDADKQAIVRQMIEMDMKSLGVTPWFVDNHDKLVEIFANMQVTKRLDDEDLEVQ